MREFLRVESADEEKGKHLCLATSKDGQTWVRPDLGLTEFNDNRDNNLFPFEAVEAGVFLDPSASPEKRFRLLHNRHWPDPVTAGVYLSDSPDGIHWVENETRLFPRVPDSQPSGFFNQRDNCYHIYQRAWTSDRKRAVSLVAVDKLEKPWPFDETVEPLKFWGPDKVATPSLELPIVMKPDQRDADNVHLYTSGVIRYPWASDTYFGFPAAYFHFKGPALESRALDGNDGTFDVQIAVSRDGVQWNRFREPWVEPDYRDGVALQLVSMATGMIRRGREIHQFFVGWPYTHNRPVEWDRDPESRTGWTKKDLGGIYRATTRVDGFVARKIACDSLTKTEQTWKMSIEAKPVQAVQSAIRAELGISVLPRSAIAEGLSILSCKTLPKLPNTSVLSYFRTDRSHPNAERFIDYGFTLSVKSAGTAGEIEGGEGRFHAWGRS